MNGAKGFHGSVRSVRSLTGANAVRVSHAGGQQIAPHAHDWPTLTLTLVGICRERHEEGVGLLAGPSAAFHPAGAVHQDDISACGLETLSLSFDPDWLGIVGCRQLSRSQLWLGGAVVGIRRLQRMWLDKSKDERALRHATATFLVRALRFEQRAEPWWWRDVIENQIAEVPLATQALAQKLGIGPDWLAEAYRSHSGEGMAEAAIRRRVERALHALKMTNASLADIAVASGFCDQSHMSRGFRRLLNQSPSDFRSA